MFRSIPRTHYLLAILSTVFIFLFISQASFFAGKTITYLIFAIFVTLNVWFGGLRLGIFTIFISVISGLIFFLIPLNFLSFLFIISSLELLMFLILCVLVSLFIEKYKKSDVVSQHIKLEKELMQNIKKLESNVSAMQKEVKLRDEFLSIASHELKTPLTSMLLKIQMILHNIRNVSLANFSVENLMRQLETAEGQTKRLSQMINDLLNVSLITTGRMNLELKNESISDIVREVVKEFEEKLKRDEISLSLEAKNSHNAMVDKVRIAQVLANLITNAIKYGKGKPIEIEVKSNSSKAFIIVADNGIGIPADQKEKIFSLFERGINGKEVQGLGVGLYIANQIVKAHNGKIKVKSTPGDGSEFIVELPVK